MSAERDQRYAELLLSMGRSDAERMTQDPRGAHRSVAMWVAHELDEQSRALEIPGTLADSMREISKQIRGDGGPASAMPGTPAPKASAA